MPQPTWDVTETEHGPTFCPQSTCERARVVEPAPGQSATRSDGEDFLNPTPRTHGRRSRLGPYGPEYSATGYPDTLPLSLRLFYTPETLPGGPRTTVARSTIRPTPASLNTT